MSTSALSSELHPRPNSPGARRWIRRIVKAMLPTRTRVALESIERRNVQVRLLKAAGYTETLEKLTAKYGYTVLHGPFAGMIYPKESLLTRHGIQLLLGTYECELHPIIDAIIREPYARIIDIGSAEGYYAVGLARATGTPVYAYETEYRERAYCREMARANGVSQKVIISSWCDARALDKVATGRCLIISDCEGYEFQLFTASLVDRLQHADLLIELHGRPGEHGPGSAEHEFLKRFENTHTETLFAHSRSTFDPSFVEELFDVEGDERFVRENRPEGQRWVFLAANSVHA